MEIDSRYRSECPFCQIGAKEDEGMIMCNEQAFAVYDKYPDSKGHLLVIPFRHFQNYFDSTLAERIAIFDLLDRAKNYVDDKYEPDGYNININVGRAAGQVIMHLHVHLVPRYRK